LPSIKLQIYNLAHFTRIGNKMAIGRNNEKLGVRNEELEDLV
jgi:hypothetical protein